MNWDAVIKSLEAEIKIIAYRVLRSQEYGLQRQIDLQTMQTFTILAKALKEGYIGMWPEGVKNELVE